jgi:hypothetical protein
MRMTKESQRILKEPCSSVIFSQQNSHAWFQASAAMQMRSALFWDITQRWVVVVYWRFGTTCRSHLQGSRGPRRKPKKTARRKKTAWLSSLTSSPLKIVPTGCPKTSIYYYHSRLRNIAEERVSYVTWAVLRSNLTLRCEKPATNSQNT